MDLPAAPDVILEVNCGCSCRSNRCSCVKPELPCTDICGCNGKNSDDMEELGDEDQQSESEASDDEVMYEHHCQTLDLVDS